MTESTVNVTLNGPTKTAPGVAPAPASAVPSLVVAAVSFIIVLGMILSIWVMASKRHVSAAPATRAAGGVAPGADSDVVMLLENNFFVTPLPPTGDRSITYQYSVAVKVAHGRRAGLDDLVAPGGRNMLPAVREQVRRTIASEDYLKLRAEQLDDVKRRIRHYLNGLLGGDVVEDVIFDKWNVIS